MKVFRDAASMRAWRLSLKGTVGFVPTMGALHAGHGSLVEAAKGREDFCVVSIFVNPTQFNDPNDLKNYPRPEADDLRALETWGADAVFLPSPREIYADQYRFKVTESEDSRVLCGAHRPGHFDGVLTIVLKLLNLVAPDRAYFGEKDFQQLRLITDMVKALCVPVEIVPCPTVREADGLAMSSRNVRLSARERELAIHLPKVLMTAPDVMSAWDELSRLGFKVDYVEERWGRRLAAAHLGSVRLIDNVDLKVIRD